MFRRRPVVVRRTPGIVGTVARTAAVVGTAAVTSHAVSSHYQNQAAEAQEANQVVDLQNQVADLQSQQVQQAVPAAAPAPAAGGSDMMSQLTQLAQMKESGILSEAEFEAAKAKLLAG